MITDICGDILTKASVDNGFGTIVCHQVNCKGVMGSGLAKQIKDKFPLVFAAYRDKCFFTFPPVSLGDVQFVSVLDECGYVIANCFGQERYGTDKRYTDYNALRKCFKTVHSNFPNDTIRIPYKMGCGFAGGDWSIVRGIIEEEFSGDDCRIEIWRLPLGYKSTV